jgi:hypothetical protein
MDYVEFKLLYDALNLILVLINHHTYFKKVQ